MKANVRDTLELQIELEQGIIAKIQAIKEAAVMRANTAAEICNGLIKDRRKLLEKFEAHLDGIEEIVVLDKQEGGTVAAGDMPGGWTPCEAGRCVYDKMGYCQECGDKRITGEG